MPSLNKELQWQPALEQLKLPVTGGSLPAVTRCPFCHTDSLAILADRLYGGYRYDCGGCGRTGDLLQLAARVWDVSLATAVDQLQRGGSLKAVTRQRIAKYETLINNRRRFTDFMATAHSRHRHDNPLARQLVQQLNLRANLSGERYQKGPARLWGLSSKEEVELLLGGNRGRTRKRIFIGPNWDRLIVIPFRDLPGRLCGLLCGGRAFGPEDFVYVPLCDDAEPESKYEAGLAAHPQAGNAARRYEHSLIAVDDPRRWLEIQYAHFETSMQALPLVLWRSRSNSDATDMETQHAWEKYYKQKIIFWHPQLTPAVLAQSVRYHAQIYLQNQPPQRGLSEIVAEARHWSAAFEQFVDARSDSEVRELLLQTRRYGVDVSTASYVCPAPVRDRVESVLDEINSVRSVFFHAGEVVERNDCWYLVNSKTGAHQLLVDGVLRLDQLVMTGDEAYYRGRLRYRNEDLPFYEKQKTVETKTLNWMWQQLAARKRGLLRYNPFYEKHIVFLSTQFHAPELISAPGPVGWSADRQQFILPHFTLSAGPGLQPIDASLFPAAAPGRPLTPLLEPLDALDVKAALETPDAAALWAATSALLASSLAPVYRKPADRIGAVGAPAADAMAAAGEILGCERRIARPRGSEPPAGFGWPTRLDLPRQRHYGAYTEAVARGNYPPGGAVYLSPLPAKMARLVGGWTLLVGDRGCSLSQTLSQAVRRVIVAWLDDWARRGFVLPHPTAAGVLTSLGEFLQRQRLSAGRLSEANQLLQTYSDVDAAAAFGELLLAAIARKELRLEQEDYAAGSPELLITPRGVLANRPAMLRAVSQTEDTVLDAGHVARVLESQNALLEDRDGHWLLCREWWSRLRKRDGVKTQLSKD